MLIYISPMQSVTVKRGERLTKLICRKRNMQPTPHATLSNVGILNHMTLQMLEEGLEQNHRLQFNQGVKVEEEMV